ncbi:zinc transporter 2-like isoform X2 [Mizuhopecten yessoensis]|uniref:zinc transporter 2-like isoform X2 n=1 Tax=Mizuhopecten yessoensis TaxID=6573 RepID=UPI000B45827B|nr:zinc transporter 2-like isoform X2 [Mizuhopecten yessoensis]
MVLPQNWGSTHDTNACNSDSADQFPGEIGLKLGHCHANKMRAGLDKTARRKLLLASGLCLFFMTAEFIGGILAHSLAILSDAAHMLTDLASFLISLFAIFLASRPATKKLSFGWYRAEILGALMSIVMLWVLTGILAYMGVQRIIKSDYTIEPVIMLITASLGVCINILMGLTLHQHGHTHGGGGGGHSHHHDDSDTKNLVNSSAEDRSPGYGSVTEMEQQSQDEPHEHSSNNINVRAAFIHVLGDLLQSIGVLIAAVIIFFKPEWKIADPICTFIFSFLVLVTTFTVVRDLLRVLMEGTPRGMDIENVQSRLYKLPGVKDIHDLRVWSLSMDKLALSVHLAVSAGHDPLEILKAATQMIQLNFGIQETTIQTEAYEEEMLNCTQCQDLPD